MKRKVLDALQTHILPVLVANEDEGVMRGRAIVLFQVVSVLHYNPKIKTPQQYYVEAFN